MHDPTVARDESTPSRTMLANAPAAPPGFTLLHEVGRGGMGVVYSAQDLAMDREVAVKFLLEEYKPDSSTAARFIEEARITGQLQHPGIPAVYQVGALPNGQPYLAMKLIKGSTLAALLKIDRKQARDHNWDEPRRSLDVLSVIEAISQAVGYAHAHNVIHRDLKPANIMVGSFGEVQVMDWGLAKVLNPSQATATDELGRVDPEATTAATVVRSIRDSDGSHTVAGSVLGTPAYMAPEQAAGEIDKVDFRADVFGLGAILCVLLTGKPPFVGHDAESVRLAAVRGKTEEAFARLDAAGADPDVIALCKRCLAFEPSDRPASGDEVAAAVATLRRAADERARQAERDKLSAEVQAREQAKRRRVVQALLADAVMGFLAVSIGGAAIASLWRQAVAARESSEEAKGLAVKAQGEAEAAQKRSDAERKLADMARDEAVASQKREVEARKRVESYRAKMEQIVYGRTVEVAQQNWRDNNLLAARTFLTHAPPNLRGWEWHYVDRLCHAELLSLKGHKGAIHSVAFSPDGTRIATASADHTAKVWDARTGTELLTLKGHTGQVCSVSFSPDGSGIVTADNRDKTARVWDARTGAELLILKGHNDGVTSASFSPDGKRIVTASWDHTVRVWDSRTGAELFTFKGHQDNVAFASFSLDGSRIVSASNDKTAKVWDSRTGEVFLTLAGHTDVLSFASFSEDDSRISTASFDKTAKIWDAKSGASLVTLRGHKGFVRAAAFNYTGSKIVTASSDWTAKVWDTATGAEIRTLLGHNSVLGFATFSQDGSRIVTANGDMTARVWDAKTGVDSLTLHADKPRHVAYAAFSPNGTQVAIGTMRGSAVVRDAQTGTLSRMLRSRSNTVRQLAFSSDGSRIVTTDILSATVWEVNTGARLLTLKGHKRGIGIRSACFSSDGSRIATAEGDGTANVWNAATGTELLTLKGHKRAVMSVAFNPKGSRILTAGHDGIATIWDAKTGAKIFTLKGHAGPLTDASFSPDGSRIITASQDKTSKVWDAGTGEELFTLVGHTDIVNSAKFSPDGSRIITASADRTAKIWDTEYGIELLSLKGHVDSVYSASFSNDGSRIVTCSKDGSVKVWDSRPVRETLMPDPYTQRATYTYKTVGELPIKADVYRLPGNDVRPVIVWIHGGGLITGSRGGPRLDQRKRYLDAGYVIVSIDYRLAPETKLPGIIEDLRDAIKWVRSKGPGLFRIDPKRLAVVGHSAGGYLALMAGFTVQPRPQALIAFYGYGDVDGDWCAKPHAIYRKTRPLFTREEALKAIGKKETTNGGARGRSNFYTYCRQNGVWPKEVVGFDPVKQPKKFDRFCPVRNVTKDFPPTLLLHGDKDIDVPHEQSAAMDEALKRAGAPHAFITIKGGGHGFDGKGMQDSDVAAAFAAIEKFLQRHVGK